MVEKAENMARFAHRNQTYGDNSYFNNHIKSVVALTQLLMLTTFKNVDIEGGVLETLCTVAYLHDIVEDTEVNLQDIDRVFGADVAVSVRLLTKGLVKGQTLEEYLIAIKANKYSYIVKIADILANTEANLGGQITDFRRASYYENQFNFLTGKVDKL